MVSYVPFWCDQKTKVQKNKSPKPALSIYFIGQCVKNPQFIATALGPGIHYANIMDDYKMEDIDSIASQGPNQISQEKNITTAVRDCLICPFARISECLVSYLCLEHELNMLWLHARLRWNSKLYMLCHLLNVYTKFETDISKQVEKSPENLDEEMDRWMTLPRHIMTIFSKGVYKSVRIIKSHSFSKSIYKQNNNHWSDSKWLK